MLLLGRTLSLLWNQFFPLNDDDMRCLSDVGSKICKGLSTKSESSGKVGFNVRDYARFVYDEGRVLLAVPCSLSSARGLVVDVSPLSSWKSNDENGCPMREKRISILTQ